MTTNKSIILAVIITMMLSASTDGAFVSQHLHRFSRSTPLIEFSRAEARISRRRQGSKLRMDSEPSFFARSLDEARRRKGLPDDILDSSRMTDSFQDLAQKQMNHGTSPTNERIEKTSGAPNGEKKKGRYQRIEEWDAERNAKGTLSWEEKVQFEGQRYGNQVKQNAILQKFLR